MPGMRQGILNASKIPSVLTQTPTGLQTAGQAAQKAPADANSMKGLWPGSMELPSGWANTQTDPDGLTQCCLQIEQT